MNLIRKRIIGTTLACFGINIEVTSMPNEILETFITFQGYGYLKEKLNAHVGKCPMKSLYSAH
jgi:hypothetical protein